MLTDPSPYPAEQAIQSLLGWEPPSSLRDVRDEYVALVRERGGAALDRNGGPVHLTASCFIFDSDLTHVLLCFHRKGQFWVQVGGHIDADDGGLVPAALREAREESGLEKLTVVDGVYDLDRHELAAAFGRCRAHWDVGVAALAPMVQPKVSDESEDVAWFPLNALPGRMADSMPRRIAVMLEQLRV